MTDNNRMRCGSLQFYPRVRAKKIIPSVNWKPVSKEGVGLLGFIGYKAGMISVWAKDNTENSLTKGKRLAIPATVIECPAMKIYSVRFYRGGKVMKEVVVSNEKDLKKKVKLSKEIGTLDNIEDYEDMRAVLYSEVKKTGIGKKKADFLEIGISGSVEEKLNFIKERIGKEISVREVFKEGLVDVRAVTKGFGSSGPVKRFGIAYKDHKSEKGQKRPGSIGSFGKRRVEFRAPQMGQQGFFKRISYNNLILEIGNVSEKDINKKSGFDHYGVVKNDYIILKGSVPGPKKRGIVITPAIRPTKYQAKKSFEVMELR